MRMVHKRDLDAPEYRGPKMRYWAGFNVLPATVGIIPLNGVVGAGLLGNFPIGGVFSNQFAVVLESIWAYEATDLGPAMGLLTNGILANVTSGGKELLTNILLALLPPDTGLMETVAIPAAALAAVQLAAHRGQRFSFGSWRPLIPKGEAFQASFTIPAALAALPVGGVITSLWFEVRAIGYIE